MYRFMFFRGRKRLRWDEIPTKANGEVFNAANMQKAFEYCFAKYQEGGTVYGGGDMTRDVPAWVPAPVRHTRTISHPDEASAHADK